MAGGSGILTFAETKEGKLTPVAREAVGAAFRVAHAEGFQRHASRRWMTVGTASAAIATLW